VGGWGLGMEWVVGVERVGVEAVARYVPASLWKFPLFLRTALSEMQQKPRQPLKLPGVGVLLLCRIWFLFFASFLSDAQDRGAFRHIPTPHKEHIS